MITASSVQNLYQYRDVDYNFCLVLFEYIRVDFVLQCIRQKLMYQQESGLFDFRRSEVSPLLLVVDRRDDPVSPLLNQWTYQVINLCFGLVSHVCSAGCIWRLPRFFLL